jgi:hypothetical protein
MVYQYVLPEVRILPTSSCMAVRQTSVQISGHDQRSKLINLEARNHMVKSFSCKVHVKSRSTFKSQVYKGFHSFMNINVTLKFCGRCLEAHEIFQLSLSKLADSKSKLESTAASYCRKGLQCGKYRSRSHFSNSRLDGSGNATSCNASTSESHQTK